MTKALVPASKARKMTPVAYFRHGDPLSLTLSNVHTGTSGFDLATAAQYDEPE